jgi:hypothetical protein
MTFQDNKNWLYRELERVGMFSGYLKTLRHDPGISEELSSHRHRF